MIVLKDIVMLASLVFMSAVFAVSGSNHAEDYERLYSDVMAGNSEARRLTPPFNVNGTVNVDYNLNLINVLHFDRRTGEAEFLVWEDLAWNDFRLRWDSDEYNRHALHVPISSIWSPDLFTYNSLDSDQFDAQGNVLTIVSCEGDVRYIPPNTKKILCAMNEEKTVASCKLKVGSWTFNGGEINLNYTTGLKVDNFEPNVFAESVDNIQVARNEKTYPCCPETYVDLTFNFDLHLAAPTRFGPRPGLHAHYHGDHDHEDHQDHDHQDHDHHDHDHDDHDHEEDGPGMRPRGQRRLNRKQTV